MLNSRNSLIGSSSSIGAADLTAASVAGLLVAPEGKGIIGRITSHDSWSNVTNAQPGSSGNWTTYYNYSAHAGNSFVQFMNMLFGDGMGSTGDSQMILGSRGQGVAESRVLQFANGNRVGHTTNLNYNTNNAPTGGYGFSCMPIRNTSTAAMTVTVYAYVSNYWSSGTEGICLFVLAPSGGGKYSTVTSTTSTLISNAGYSTSTQQLSLSGTVSIPAESTVLIMLTNTDWYQTTNRFQGTNHFYNLNTTFINPSIICDMRILSTLAYARFNKAYNEADTTALVSWSTIWTQCASLYGDR